jgi:hypothetical protein
MRASATTPTADTSVKSGTCAEAQPEAGRLVGTINGSPRRWPRRGVSERNDEICIQYILDWSTINFGNVNHTSSAFPSAGCFLPIRPVREHRPDLNPAARTGSVRVTLGAKRHNKAVRIYHNGTLTGRTGL